MEDSGRDLEIILPLVFFSEKYLNCEVEFAFAWDIHAVYRKKPDLVLLPGTSGNIFLFKISKYAYQLGIRVFALVTEGNYRTDGSFNYWGCNREDGDFYQDYICLWSKRAYDFLMKEIPQFKDKIVFSGATGFDRYAFHKFTSREEYLAKKNLPSYKNIVGYAAWGFGKLSNELGRKELLFFFRNDVSRLEWAEKQMYLVEKIIREAVEQYPDILFILKKHPRQTHDHLVKDGINEIVRLKDYPNVLYISKNEDIHDIINVCDVWLGFETTTAMESWLLKKPSIFLTPDPNFNRTSIYTGCANVQNFSELQTYLDEFFNSGHISDFDSDEKFKNRNKIIADAIGYGDGFNHIRTAYYLKKSLDNIDTKSRIPKLSWRYFSMYILMQMGKLFYIRSIFRLLPKFKKTLWVFDRRKLKNIPVLQKKYQLFMEEFYQKHNIGKRFKEGSLFEELIENQKK